MTKNRVTSMKIVIAEDDAITVQWLKKKIEELEMNCLVAGTFADGSQALDYIREHGADVVFTDIRMPVMDGMEFLSYLRSDGIPVYKVIFSAYGRFDYARWAIKLGAHEFLPKSEITGESLRQTLLEAEDWLSRNRPDERETPEEIEPEVFSEKQLELERELRRMAEEKDGEDALQRYAAEKGLDVRKLLLANLYFGKEVRRETVMEFLYLYLRQEGRLGDCFQNNSHEFSILYNQSQEARVMDDLNRLRSILQAHLGVPVYLGASLDGNAGKETPCTMADLYRRASAARENRRFFGIPGCICYGQLKLSASAEEISAARASGAEKLVACVSAAEGSAAGVSAAGESAAKESAAGVSVAKEPGAEKPAAGGDMTGTPVCVNFGSSADRIVALLGEQRYGSALEELRAFLAAMRGAVTFHTAYVRALSNHILSAYLQEVRRYPLDEKERRDVNGIELWLGWSVSDLNELGDALLRVAAFLDGILRRKNRSMSYSSAVRQAVRYMQENYERKVTLDEVAASVHLSRAYLSMLFKKEVGQNFSVYLQEIRLEAARGLMGGQDLSVQEIADRTGFFDASHLSRTFKVRYGCSPMEYRKEILYKSQ